MQALLASNLHIWLQLFDSMSHDCPVHTVALWRPVALGLMLEQQATALKSPFETRARSGLLLA